MGTANPSADALWALQTFGHAELPDLRLNGRLVELAACWAAKPGSSIPQACGSWARTKAAYRFLENPRVSWKVLALAAARATARQCAGRPAILVLQDTTTISLPGLKACVGLGPIGEADGVQGLFLHHAVALQTNGQPIGLLHSEIWARDPACHGQAAQRKARPFEEKESARWVRGIRGARARVAEQWPAAARPRLIHVMDREGDIHEVMAEVQAGGDGAVIRCAHNRSVQAPERYAHEAVRAAPLLGRVKLEVPRQRGQPKREAQVEIRARPVTLDPDPEKYPQRRPLNLMLIEVWEPVPPPGVEPLHWYLWTTEAVTSLADALSVMAFYALRWRIEDIHLVLKEGCRAEKLQLETAERLANALLLYDTIAIRMVALREAARQSPEAPCTVVLQESEWRTLWTRQHGKAPRPEEAPPSVREAVVWIGRLGGHLGRQRDGLPGVRTLWRGWRDLMLLARFYEQLYSDP